MDQTYVAPEELSSKFRSKRDLYKQLTYDLDIFLPSFKNCPLHFIRQLLSGKKSALKTSAVTMLSVPKYSEISIKKLWQFVKECEELLMYFPDLDNGKLPERHFTLGILCTIRTKEMKQLIADSRKNRSIQKTNDVDMLVEMTSAAKEQFLSLFSQKTTPGRANFLLKAGAKLKRKKATHKKYSANLDILKSKSEDENEEEKEDMN